MRGTKGEARGGAARGTGEGEGRRSESVHGSRGEMGGGAVQGLRGEARDGRAQGTRKKVRGGAVDRSRGEARGYEARGGVNGGAVHGGRRQRSAGPHTGQEGRWAAGLCTQRGETCAWERCWDRERRRASSTHKDRKGDSAARP